MPYNEALAQRVRKQFAGNAAVSEKKMFGGLTFMLGDRMCCGIVKDDLMVRVNPADHEKLLTKPHVRPMDFTGRPMQGFLYVGPKGCERDADLKKWLQRATTFATSAPTKARRSRTDKRP